MIDLRDSIATIRAQLEEGSPRNLTYAALECRLALERICYERLRAMHDYISHDEIRWQPARVIKILTEGVDPHVADTYTLSMSRHPLPNGLEPTREDYEAQEFIEIGTQVGFKANYVQKLWNALSNVALHANLPVNKADQVRPYGDATKIRKQVEVTLAEIERISTGTMISTGLGKEVKFECLCGATNKRRMRCLPEGKIVSCINPECAETWDVEISDGEYEFARRGHDLECLCGRTHFVTSASIEKMARHEWGTILCDCGGKLLLRWSLSYAKMPPESEPAVPGEAAEG